MLMAVKDFLQSRSTATVAEICVYFNQPVEVVRDWLSFWQRKGCVQALTLGCRQACSGCAVAQIERYQWVASG